MCLAEVRTHKNVDTPLAPINGRDQEPMGQIRTPGRGVRTQSGIDGFGQVIGVNFSGANSAKGVSGISFAIPTEIVRDVVPEIVAHGSVKRASIGVSVTARRHKKDHGFETAITITKTNLDDSPLKPGDIISTVNGTPIGRRYDLIRLLNRSLVGTVVEIEVIRSGQPIKINTQAVAK